MKKINIKNVIKLILGIIIFGYSFNQVLAWNYVGSPTNSQLGEYIGTGFTLAYSYTPGSNNCYGDKYRTFVELKFNGNTIYSFIAVAGGYQGWPNIYARVESQIKYLSDDVFLMSFYNYNLDPYCSNVVVQERRNILVNVNDGSVKEINSNSFVGNNLTSMFYVYHVGDDIEFIGFTANNLTGSVLGSVSASGGFVEPKLNGTIPIYYDYSLSGYGGLYSQNIFGWLYTGTDSNIYFLSTTGFYKKVIVGASGRLLGFYPFLGINSSLYSSDSGNNIIPYTTELNVSSGNLTDIAFEGVKDGSGNHIIYSSGNSIYQITDFQNPILFMLNSSGSVYSWDLNCKTAGYTDCVFNVGNGKNYCGNSNNEYSPNGEQCGLEVDFSGINTGGSVGGSDELISYTGTGGVITYITEDETCTGITFTGSYSLTGITENLDPASCSWQTFSGSFRCQDDYGHLCLTSGDSCLTSIYNPTQYSTGSTYLGDITKYNCSTIKYSCNWFDINTCGNNVYCYVDNNYCRVKNDYKDKTPVINGNTGSTSEILTPGYELENLGSGFGSGTLSGSGSGTLSGSISTGYSSIVWTNSGTKQCAMFSGSTFLYSGNGSAYNINFSFSNLSNNKILHDYLLIYLDKVESIVTAPINSFLALINAVSTVNDNSDVCFLGIGYKIEYQKYLSMTGVNIPTFTALDNYKLSKGNSTFIDYLAVFLICGIITIPVIFLLFPKDN